MFIKRTIYQKVKKLTTQFPVIVITGARQTGKTTLLKELFPSYNYISLDLPSDAELAENNPEEFLLQYPKPLIVDEIQYAPKLFRHIKRFVDDERSRSGQFILTGSQKFTLMKEVSDSLAGRCAILDLETLSYREIKSEYPTSSPLEIMTRGQFPELWNRRDIESSDYYSAYLSTYLERDVRQILNVVSLRDFERFIRITASLSGQLLNKTEIAKSVGVSVKAIQDWISVLEASNQIVLLEPWYQNFGKRIVKSPKLYFCDTGFLCYLLGLNSDNILKSPLLGHIWESFLFSELRKENRLIKQPVNIWYYRDQQAREIDFFIEGNGNISLIECKWKEFADKADVKNIAKISKEIKNSTLPWNLGKHYIICNTKVEYPITESCNATNIAHIPEMLKSH